jgi:hypothetical protein
MIEKKSPDKGQSLPVQSRLLLYEAEDGQTRIEVRLQDETVWMTQAAMAELYQITPQNITTHLKAIYNEGELEALATCKEYLQVQREGSRKVSRSRKFYNLPAIIAVGYRVRSLRGTQFRRWATERLNEYLVKGFTMDDERLKAGVNIGSDYFDEMLERIRDIRSSEKRFYQKIRDIYKLAVDYDPKAEETLEFFAIVQNKLHFAISGKAGAKSWMPFCSLTNGISWPTPERSARRWPSNWPFNNMQSFTSIAWPREPSRNRSPMMLN